MPGQSRKQTSKLYDERYFRRWYSNPRSRVVTPAERARRVAMVLAAAEFVTGRAVRTVLDVGCGEGRWQPLLRRLRPHIEYTGIDSSEYAVSRHGASRNILLGAFDAIDAVLPSRRYDLVVASDIIHYLSDSVFARGMAQLAPRVAGLAYLDFFAEGDAVEGDLHGMQLRPPHFYHSHFARNDLHHVGLQLYARTTIFDDLAAMERANLG